MFKSVNILSSVSPINLSIIMTVMSLYYSLKNMSKLNLNSWFLKYLGKIHSFFNPYTLFIDLRFDGWKGS